MANLWLMSSRKSHVSIDERRCSSALAWVAWALPERQIFSASSSSPQARSHSGGMKRWDKLQQADSFHTERHSIQ
jgi:hypothetical protein